MEMNATGSAPKGTTRASFNGGLPRSPLTPGSPRYCAHHHVVDRNIWGHFLGVNHHLAFFSVFLRMPNTFHWGN